MLLYYYCPDFNNGKTEVTHRKLGEDPGLSDMKAHILVRLATTYIIKSNHSLTSVLSTKLECLKSQVHRSSQTTKLLKSIYHGKREPQCSWLLVLSYSGILNA